MAIIGTGAENNQQMPSRPTTPHADTPPPTDETPFIPSKEDAGALDRGSRGSQDHQWNLELDEDNIIVDDEELSPERGDPDEEELTFGSAFEKLDEYDHHLDSPNPWHTDLQKPLFASQIICFR